MADGQCRVPHAGLRARATAIAFAAVAAAGVLTTGVDTARADCSRWEVLVCVGDDDSPPPPPPPPPKQNAEDWNRINRARIKIYAAHEKAKRLAALSDALDDQLEGQEDIGVDYASPLKEDGPLFLDSLAEFETLKREAEAWSKGFSGKVLEVGGSLTGKISLQLSLGPRPEDGPEWGKWHAKYAEGVAETAVEAVKSVQGHILGGVVYDESLDPEHSLREIVRRLVTEAVDLPSKASDEATKAFSDKARREISEQLRYIRAGIFGGQRGPVPPVAAEDIFRVDPLSPTVLTEAQILSNDKDPNGDIFTIVWVGDAANGTVELVLTSPEAMGDGPVTEGADPGGFTPARSPHQRVVFTPGEEFAYPQSDEGFFAGLSHGGFRYTIRDSRGQEATSFVLLSPSYELSIAHDDTVKVRPRSSTIIPAADLLANDESPDGRILSINRLSDSRGGAAVLNGSTVTWTANDQAPDVFETYRGSFTYHVWDGMGGDISATVTVLGDRDLARELNAAPEVGDDLVTYPTGGETMAIPLDDLIANDRDPERRALEFEGFQPAVNGTVSYDRDRRVFTFALDDDSKSGSFRYTMSDFFGATGTATVRVERYDRPPVTHPDLVTVDTKLVPAASPSDGPRAAMAAVPPGSIPYADVLIPVADLLENDRDPEGLPLRLAAVEDPRNGTVRIDGDSVVFTPDGRAPEPVIITNGRAPDQPRDETYGIHGGGFAYLAEDPYGNRTRGWVNLSVTSGKPVASDDHLSGFVNAPTPIPVDRLLRNDNHPNGRTITLEEVQDPVNGRAAYVPGGNIRFVPGPDFAAKGGSFTYRIADAVGGRDTAIVHLTPGNALPVPADDRIEVSKSEPTTIDVGTLLANDAEPDGEALRVVTILNTRGGSFKLDHPDSDALARSVDGVPMLFEAVWEAHPFPEGATLGGNRILFVPGPDFAETGARFDYVVMDDRYGQATATVLLSAGNEAPVGQPDVVVRPRAERYEIAAGDLTANDIDADGDPLSIRSVAAGRGGAVSLSSDGETVVFEPATATANGIFSYVVVDPMGGESFSTVTVQQAVGVPEAVNDVVDVTGDGPWRVAIADIMVNDRDPAGDGLTFGGVVDTGPAGRASFDGVSPFVLYEPAPGDEAGRTSTTCSNEGAAAGNAGSDTGAPVAVDHYAYGFDSDQFPFSDMSADHWAYAPQLFGPPSSDADQLPDSLGNSDPAPCQSTGDAAGAYTFRYRINTVRGSAVGAVTLRRSPEQDRPTLEARDDRVAVAFSAANEAVIPVSALLANDGFQPAGSAGDGLTVIDIFDGRNVYGHVGDDGETIILGATRAVDADAAASTDRIGGSFRYRIGDGSGGFATAEVTLTARPERPERPPITDGMTYEPTYGPADDGPGMRVDNTQFDVELVQSVLVAGDANPFLPQNPLGGTPLGNDAGSTPADYSGTYAVTCTVIRDDAAINADFQLAGSHSLTAAQTAGTLSLDADTPQLSIAGPFPNPPDFALSRVVSDGFGGQLRSRVNGRFIEPDRISALYSLSYPGSTITSDFQCDGRR